MTESDLKLKPVENLSFSDLSSILRTKIKNCYNWNYYTPGQCCNCKRQHICEELATQQ